ncbi:PREDICTED: cytochrome P450 4c21-like [Wasmannia auropunctata]|uniref:cytochrome P450 4c21-like n=1 Tax=Wasmannia auropunctata TaxID=64793 RepID=UPI0005F0160C|nr:PREDICTED: cytochrome P450 4c21-like [Wasmannia auropunctata]
MFVNAALIAAICIISGIVWNYCRRKFFPIKDIDLPGPKTIPKNLCSGTPDEILDNIFSLGRYYPSPFKMSVSISSLVVIYEQSQVKTVLKSPHCLNKGILFKLASSTFGIRLFTAHESIWVRNRKIIAPFFSPTMLQEFFNIFVEQSLILANKLEKVGLNGKEITFLEHVTRSTLDIVCDSMGVKMESNKKDQYLKIVTRLKEIIKHRIYSIMMDNVLLFHNVIFNLTALGREQQKLLKSLDCLINELHELNKSHTTETKTDTNKRFLDILMKLSKIHKTNVTQEMIYDNVIMLLLASDAISITLDFVIFMLANFPEVQEKVYEELSEIYGTKTPMSVPVKHEDLQHMHYLDRVIKETMRLFPAIPLIDRKLTDDVRIDDVILPENTNVILPLILMNRKEECWPNPLKFDPDRFLPERIKDCLSCYHIPFGDGLRDCIATKYAMISMKVILATLVRTFVFKVDKRIQISSIKLTTDIILSTVKPLKVKIEKRNLE